MENIYVIKVKSRPDLSSLYPSERRYSASTVGGLSLAHLLLGSLLFFLSVLAGCVQGLVLSIFCLVPFAFGILASRRWYIDRNITFFFYASLFSVLVSSFCTTISAFDIVEFTNQNHVFEDKSSKDKVACNASGDSMTVVGDVVSEESRGGDYSSTTQGGPSQGEDKREEPGEEGHVKNQMLLIVNVFVGSLLETFWSLLSLRIAFRGMRNEMSDVNFGKEVGRTVVPDIILRNRHVCCSLQSLDSLQSSCGGRVGCRERVEKFLANQASLQSISGSF